MPVRRRVVFGRINRRDQTGLDPRPFAQDMMVLAESRKTIAVTRSTGGRPDRTWIAADMTTDPRGEFMTGVLGFEVVDEVRTFDEGTWSWSKAEATPMMGAPSSTTVPFAIDLRESRRWVAFATSSSIRHQNFGTGLALVLNQAIRDLQLWPTDWEFDLVLSRGTVRQWIESHPNVYRIVRTLKFSNPGLDLDAERTAMRALGANRLTEEFAARRSEILRTDSAEFESKLEGIETGDARLQIWARGQSVDAEFRSDDAADFQFVDDFGNDLALGMEYVLAALRDYQAPASGRSAKL